MKGITCFLIVLLSSGCITAQKNTRQTNTNTKPNIVLIFVDDMGYGDLSIYGSEIPTPNIDRIGKQGIQFTEFYSAAPVCTPSRYGLLTGTYPNHSRHGLDRILFPSDMGHFDDAETTLGERLKESGYTTALCGKWHLGSKEPKGFPTRHGFDSFSGFLGGTIDFYHHTYGSVGPDWYINNKPAVEKGYSTDLITNRAVEVIDAAKNNSQPFFLYLSYNATHCGKSDPANLPQHTIMIHQTTYEGHDVANTLQAPEGYLERFSHIADLNRRMYAAMLANLDDNVGRVLDKLEKDGLLQNTMIWFISDNGGDLKYGASNGSLSGQKGRLLEGGIRVPGLVCWKGRIKPGQVIESPVCNIDLVPTICAITGLQARSKTRFDGMDISSILFKGATIEREIFWKYAKQTAIRKGDWKLLNGVELYNLKNDPGEKTDLATKYPLRVKELNDRFLRINKTMN